jgi:hypothetical protein
MHIEKLKGGWIKLGSVIAYPYEWQRPVKTEEWIYETLTNFEVNSLFIEYIAFPWATLIDLIHRGKNEKAQFLLEALTLIPPKKTLIRVTACQHIKFETLIDILLKINITDLFASHKEIGFNLLEKIRLYPLCLYPVSYYSKQKFEKFSTKERKYLYSFVGAYDKNCYISDIREKIFAIPQQKNTIILKRHSWHFDLDVYKKQINQINLSAEEHFEIENNAYEYSNILMNSTYSLCPSGSGPNSIRFWESIVCGSIPILLSDNLDVAPLPEFITYHRVPENQLYSFLINLEKLQIKHNKINDINIEKVLLGNLLSIFDSYKSLKKIIAT